MEEIQELLRDPSKLFTWLLTLRCHMLSLTKNEDHRAEGQTVHEWLAANPGLDIPAHEIAEMMRTQDVWCLTIYPGSMALSFSWYSATAQGAIIQAMENQGYWKAYRKEH